MVTIRRYFCITCKGQTFFNCHFRNVIIVQLLFASFLSDWHSSHFARNSSILHTFRQRQCHALCHFNHLCTSLKRFDGYNQSPKSIGSSTELCGHPIFYDEYHWLYIGYSSAVDYFIICSRRPGKKNNNCFFFSSEITSIDSAIRLLMINVIFEHWFLFCHRELPPNGITFSQYPLRFT